MNNKIIIFDFDGTLADSYDAIVRITNQLADEFGYKPIAEEKLLKFKKLSSREIVKQSEISLFKLPFLLRRVLTELGKEVDKLEPIPGIEAVLWQLKSQGYCLGIITSNAKENVINFLENQRLESLFTFIYSNTTIFGKHRVIRAAIKQHQMNQTSVIYVGDETRDVRAAQKSGVSVVAVGWGFNAATALAKHNPDFLVEQPLELLGAIADWDNSWQEELQSKG